MRRGLFASLGLALVLAVSGVASAAEQPLDRIVAVVNDDAIMASELADRVAQARSQLAQRNIDQPPDSVLRQQVLDRMVLEQIQLQMAKKANLTVDDTELNRAVRSVARNNGMSLDQFAEALKKDGLTLADVRDQVRRQMLIRQLQERRVASQVKISDQEVDRTLAQQGADANVRYHLGHILVALPQSPSPDQVRQAQQQAEALHQRLQDGADFAELAAAKSDGANALQGGDLGWRSGAELPTVFADVVPTLAVGDVSQPLRSPSGFHLVKLLERKGGQDQQPKLVQEQKIRHILIQTNPNRDADQARRLAEKARARIMGGEDFASVAQQVSDDRGSALNGGELGWVRPGQMVPAFEDAANRLAVGEISQPVRSRYGYHIIQVENRRQRDVSDEARRDKVRQTLFQRKVNDELEAWQQQIRAEAYVDERLDQGS